MIGTSVHSHGNPAQDAVRQRAAQPDVVHDGIGVCRTGDVEVTVLEVQLKLFCVLAVWRQRPDLCKKVLIEENLANVWDRTTAVGTVG